MASIYFDGFDLLHNKRWKIFYLLKYDIQKVEAVVSELELERLALSLFTSSSDISRAHEYLQFYSNYETSITNLSGLKLAGIIRTH